MNEMVERVARAICAGQHIDPQQWGLFAIHAGLVIQAIREPNEAMIKAGEEASVYVIDERNSDCADARDIWITMIDEALK